MDDRITVEIGSNPIPSWAIGNDVAQIPPGDVDDMEGGKCVGATPGSGFLEGRTIVWYKTNLGPGKTPPPSLGSFADGPKTYKFFEVFKDFAAGHLVFVF